MALRTAVLVSGRGSNLGALLAAQRAGAPFSIDLVLSNQPDAGALALAAQAGVATRVLHHRGYPDRAAFDADLAAVLADAGVAMVVLAGFMRILTAGFVAAHSGRLLNIHPSLLPLYPGLDTHARALADGAREHGATVHFVSAEVDGGPRVAQVRVPVLAGDSPDTLAARVLAEEHRLLPLVLAGCAAGRISLQGGAVLFDGSPLGPAGLQFSTGNAMQLPGQPAG